MALTRQERRTKDLADTIVSALRDAVTAVDAAHNNGEKVLQTSIDALTAEIRAQGTQATVSQNKSITVQRRLFWATTAAFGAAAVYAWIAFLQKRTMDNTYAEIQKQTTIQFQHAVGTEAARVELSISPANTGILVTFENHGIVAAMDARFQFKAQRMTLPEMRTVEHPIEDELSYKAVPNTDHGGSVFGKEVSLPGYTSNTFGKLLATRETIKVEGTFSFNNGFDEITRKPVCLYWLTYQRSRTISGFSQFLDCKGFEITLGNILKQRNEDNKK